MTTVQQAVEEEGAIVTQAEAGYVFTLEDGVSIQVLGPPQTLMRGTKTNRTAPVTTTVTATPSMGTRGSERLRIPCLGRQTVARSFGTVEVGKHVFSQRLLAERFKSAVAIRREDEHVRKMSINRAHEPEAVFPGSSHGPLVG